MSDQEFEYGDRVEASNTEDFRVIWFGRYYCNQPLDEYPHCIKTVADFLSRFKYCRRTRPNLKPGQIVWYIPHYHSDKKPRVVHHADGDNVFLYKDCETTVGSQDYFSTEYDNIKLVDGYAYDHTPDAP